MNPSPTFLRRAARSLGLVSIGVLSTLGALSLMHASPAQAAKPGPSLAALAARLNADEATIAALKAKTAPFSLSTDKARHDGRTNTELTIARVNVHIVSGSGNTTDGTDPPGTPPSTLTGLGNLIIGYNSLRNNSNFRDVRTGSHNLILGDGNNYSGYGGLVAGNNNNISGGYASVSGGFSNTASASSASVSGGQQNTASGALASVSGGSGNTASGLYASVSGGSGNKASGNYASVGGGSKETANGSYTADGIWISTGPTWAAATFSGH